MIEQIYDNVLIFRPKERKSKKYKLFSTRDKKSVEESKIASTTVECVNESERFVET